MSGRALASTGNWRTTTASTGTRPGPGGDFPDSRLAPALFCLLLVLVLPSRAVGEPAQSIDPQTLRKTALGRIAGIGGCGGSLAWLGVPFAEPPVGPFRWRAPRPSQPWASQFMANKFGSRCPQRDVSAGQQLRSAGSENCLFLNIWSPPASTNRERKHRRPVMVWIHGRGDVSSAGSDFDGGRLAVRGDVVVVTINYRLGAFGWFMHPALQRLAVAPLEASGNFGTLDQIEALRWIHRHIAAFGGDPQNVTVFGESARGWNIYALLGRSSRRTFSTEPSSRAEICRSTRRRRRRMHGMPSIPA